MEKNMQANRTVYDRFSVVLDNIVKRTLIIHSRATFERYCNSLKRKRSTGQMKAKKKFFDHFFSLSIERSDFSNDWCWYCTNKTSFLPVTRVVQIASAISLRKQLDNKPHFALMCKL